ncbi:hypothetical protein EYV94_27960 [Puteibacter caeruleilacunae]|nr:hypothetical protein EYV94_27960 [Puteibacter caeruleilacunae]
MKLVESRVIMPRIRHMGMIACILLLGVKFVGAQEKGRFGTSPGHTFVDWTFDRNWGGSANRWSGYIGFNAFRNDDDLKDYFFGVNYYTAKLAFEGSNYGFRWLYHIKSGDNCVQTKLSELMHLSSQGNLGIGIHNPPRLLTLKAFRPRIALADQDGDASVFEFHEGTNQLRFQQWEHSGGRYIKTVMSLDMDDGRIGMGTSEPRCKLDVVGTIRAEEIKVALNEAPDYVFEDDYKLKSLEEVEEYVKEHRHLPGIASAKEMEKEGVGLAEMNKLLLEKVEELTLYSITLSKENQELKGEVVSQKEDIKSIEMKLQKLIKVVNAKPQKEEY